MSVDVIKCPVHSCHTVSRNKDESITHHRLIDTMPQIDKWNYCNCFSDSLQIVLIKCIKENYEHISLITSIKFSVPDGVCICSHLINCATITNDQVCPLCCHDLLSVPQFWMVWRGVAHLPLQGTRKLPRQIRQVKVRGRVKSQRFCVFRVLWREREECPSRGETSTSCTRDILFGYKKSQIGTK